MSAETDHLQAFLADSGVPHTVTATTGTYVSAKDPCHPHAPGSYHCRAGTGGPGLAIDVAVTVGGPPDTPGLLAIRQAIQRVDSQSAEVIYAGPGHPPCIKNGQPFTYDAQTMSGHHNHVHWAVERGTLVNWPQPPQPGGWTEHPTAEEDVAYKPVDVTIPTGADGKGWITVPYRIDQIIGYLPPGLVPEVDGRVLTAGVGFAQKDPGTEITVSGWAPNTTAFLRIRVTATVP